MEKNNIVQITKFQTSTVKPRFMYTHYTVENTQKQVEWLQRHYQY